MTKKTNLGITVTLVGAALYFLYLFYGMTALLIVSLYIFLKEEDYWLKQTAVRAIVMGCMFSALALCFSLIPSGISVINLALGFLDERLSATEIQNLAYLGRDAVNFFEKIIFLLLGFKTLKGENATFAQADQLVNKHFPNE